MLVTEFGMATEARLIQPTKIEPSRFVTELGIMTEVSPLQL